MRKTKLLFIGHDFKFLRHVIDHFSRIDQYEVQLYHHQGHDIQDFKSLAKSSLNADIIFCEWGLGNLRWLSKNKFPNQKTIVRIHSQEFGTNYLNDTNWNSIDKIILVSPHMIEHFGIIFPDHKSKCQLIFNSIDTRLFDRNKESDAIFHLGMLGILPKIKAPHIGLDILQELKKKDNRYKLLIKSQKPQEVDWLWKKEDERNYYEYFYDKIKKLNLGDSIIFNEHGSDVQDWFQKIGFILSTSDYESFHMAIPEGMSSGAIPIIRNWEGAAQLYPEKYIFKNTKEAVSLISDYSDRENVNQKSRSLKSFAKIKFGVDIILSQYEQLFNQLVADLMTNKTKHKLREILSDWIDTSEQEKNKIQEINNKQTLEIESASNQYSSQAKKISDYEIELAKKSEAINEITKQLNYKSAVLESQNHKLDELNRQINTHIRNEIEKDKLIAAIRKEKSKQETEIIDFKSESTELREKLKLQSNKISEKDLFIAELNNKHDKLIKQIECKANELKELESSIELIKQENSKLSSIIAAKDKQLAEAETILKALKIENKDWKERELNQMKKIDDLTNLAEERKQELKKLVDQSKEQQHYIQYLEKRFFNKMIGIVRKKLKR